MTGHELNDTGRTLSWGALGSFVRGLDLSTKTGAEIYPEEAEWTQTAKTNAILADIYDQLAVIDAHLATIITRKPSRRPKFYKRPGVKDENEKHIGTPMKKDELRKWLEERRNKHVRHD